MSFESPGFATLRVDASPHAAPYHAYHVPKRGNRLDGWVAKALGVAILALSAACVLALLTWSVTDPSLTNPNAPTLKPKNGLGPIGAIISDIVIQSLGLASVFALLPPVYWAAQLLSRNGIDGIRNKLVMAPFAVLALAAFLSGLPKAAAWPLGAGYGGLLGDFGFQFIAGLFGVVNAERAPLVAGVCLIATGLSLLMFSLGLTPNDIKRAVERRTRHIPDSGWVSHLKTAVVANPHDDDVLAAGPQSTSRAPQLDAFPYGQTTHPQAPVPVAAERPVPLATERPMSNPARDIGPVSPHHADTFAPVIRAEITQPADRAMHLAAQPAAAPTAAPSTREHAVPHVAAPTFAAPTPAPHKPVTPKPAMQTPAAQQVVPPRRLAYLLPPTSLLPRSSEPRADARDVHVAEKLRAQKLIATLETFGVMAEVKNQVVGPVVTTFTLEASAGTRSSRVIGLADDIARSLGLPSVRIQSIAGRTGFAIEVAHDDPVRMGLRDFVDHESYAASDMMLPLVLGATAQGEPCVADLATLPHMLAASMGSASRAGILHTLVASLVYRHTPETLKTLLVGSPRGPLGAWAGLPHAAAPLADNRTQATELLGWAAAEIDARTLRMRALAQAQSIDAYNARLADMSRANGAPAPHSDMQPMPYLAIVVDDLAELLRDASLPTVHALDAILRRGKAAGIHMIAATSRVDAEALPTQLLAMFQTRVALALASKADSRILLGDTGAEDLSAGDVLVTSTSGDLRATLGGADLHRLHVPLIDGQRVSAIVSAAHQRGEVAAPSPATMPTALQALASEPAAPARDLADSLYDHAVDIVRRAQTAQASLLKRELSLTYAMASELLDQMARDGIVSPPDADGQRRVLLARAA